MIPDVKVLPPNEGDKVEGGQRDFYVWSMAVGNEILRSRFLKKFII